MHRSALLQILHDDLALFAQTTTTTTTEVAGDLPTTVRSFWTDFCSLQSCSLQCSPWISDHHMHGGQRPDEACPYRADYFCCVCADNNNNNNGGWGSNNNSELPWFLTVGNVILQLPACDLAVAVT